MIIRTFSLKFFWLARSGNEGSASAGQVTSASA